MHIRSDAKTGTVLIRLTAKEATGMASELVRAAIQSGGAVEDGERRELPDAEEQEREG